MWPGDNISKEIKIQKNCCCPDRFHNSVCPSDISISTPFHNCKHYSNCSKYHKERQHQLPLIPCQHQRIRQQVANQFQEVLRCWFTGQFFHFKVVSTGLKFYWFFISSVAAAPPSGRTSLLHNLWNAWLNISLSHRRSMNTNHHKIFHIKTAFKKNV